MPTASTSKPGISRLLTAGGSRIPITGGTRIPSFGGRGTVAGKAPAKEKEDAPGGKKRGPVLQQESPNPKARKILRASNAPAPATAAIQKQAQSTAARKRSLGSPPVSARKRQRLELPLRSSPRTVDPLDVIPPTPRTTINQHLVHPRSPESPPRTQPPMERARSTTAFNIPLGDQSSLLGGAGMDISSGGLYSDFENGGTPSPRSKTATPARTTTGNTQRSSVTPRPRQKSTTPRRSPKSARRRSATPRRYEPKTLPQPIITPTAMQAKKEARLAEAQAKLAAARSEVEARPAPAQTMTAAQARIAAAQAEAERRLRMSVESEGNEGLSVVQEESYHEESERDDGLGEDGEEGGEEAEFEQMPGEEEQQDAEDGEDTLQPLRDQDWEDEEDTLAATEGWSSQVKTPRASASKSSRAQGRGTTTPAFKPTTTPATKPTTTPAYKPTTTPATVEPTRTTAPTTTPATALKGKRRAKFQDTPHPEPSESPSEYIPSEREDTTESVESAESISKGRPSLGFSLSPLSLNTPYPLRSQESLRKMLLEEGEIASRTRSRRASDDGTRRESLAGALSGLKLAEQGGDISMAVAHDNEEEGEEEEEKEEEEEEEDETVRHPRKSITTTPRGPAPSYSTTPRDYPSTTPRTYPFTTPRVNPSTTPGNTSTTPRNDPSAADYSTTPFYPPSTMPGDSTTPQDEPSLVKRRSRKSDSPTKGRGSGGGRGRRGPRSGASPARGGDSSPTRGDNETLRVDASLTRGRSSRGKGRGGRSASRDRRSVDEETSFMEGQSGFPEDRTQQQAYGKQSISAGHSPMRRGRGRGHGRGQGRGQGSPHRRGGASRPSNAEAEPDSGSEEDFGALDETTAADRTIKPKSPMKMEVVIPQRSTTAFSKSVSKTPFKPTARTPLFKPSSSMSSSQPTISMTVSQSTSTSKSSQPTTSAFGSPVKITLQQPTPELSSLDRSPGSHQDMITDGSIGSRQDVEHTDVRGDMAEPFDSQHEFTGSQHDFAGSEHEYTSSRQDMDQHASSRQDQDMNFTDEIPETSLPSTTAERHGTTKLPVQSSFSHLLERDMMMRSDRTATTRMENSQRTITIHTDVSHRSVTMSRSTSAKSHTPATKKKPVPKKTPGLKIVSDPQAPHLSTLTPRAPPALVDDSIEFTPASGLDFNESHMDFHETPAIGTKFAQSTPFIRKGTRPSLGLGSFNKLHLDDSMEDEEIPDSQVDPSEYDDQVAQPERMETTPQREISVAVDTSSPNRSLRTERVATPRAPRLSNPVDDEEEDEPELPPSPSAGRSSFHEGNSLPNNTGINGRRLSDILMLRAKQARDRSGDASRDRSANGSVLLGTEEMTRLSDQAKSVLRQPSVSGSKFISDGNESRVGAGDHSTRSGSPSRTSRDRSAFESSQSQQVQVHHYDTSVRFDGPSRMNRRSGTPVPRRPSEPEESDEDQVFSIPDQREELHSSGASTASHAPSDASEGEYEPVESEPQSDEEIDYDENGEPIIKISGPPEALVEAKSALMQLGYIEDKEQMERYSRTRSSRSRSRSISRAGDSTRNISISSSPRGHPGDRTTGLSRSQMMAEASRYEDWEPPSRCQLHARKWTEHDWRMLAHYMRRIQKSQALMNGLSSRQEFDLRNVDVPAVVERFIEEESHGVKLEGEWDPSEIAGRVEFLIKTEGYKKDGSWRSTLMNITAPGFSTQKTRRYEREQVSPQMESPVKARMLPAALSERPGPSRIAAAQKQMVQNTSQVIRRTVLVTQSPQQVASSSKQVSPRPRRKAQTTVVEPVQRRPHQEPEDMSVDQPSLEPSREERSVEGPSVELSSTEEPSVEQPPGEDPNIDEPSIEEQTIQEQPIGEPVLEDSPPEEVVAQEVEDQEEDEVDEGEEGDEGDEGDEVEEGDEGDEGQEGQEGQESYDEEFDQEEHDDDPSNQEQTYQVAVSASPARTRSPPKSRRYADTSVPTNRGLEASMRSAGAPPTPIARFFGTISSYISSRSQNNQTGEPSMPTLRPVSRDPIDLISDGDEEPQFPVLNHVPTPIRPTPARRNRQKRIEPRIDMPALQHVSPPRPTTEPARGRQRMRRVGSVKELAKSFELMEEKSREEAEIARNIGMRRVVSDSNQPRLIPAQVHYVPPSAPVPLNRPKVPPGPTKTAPTVPLLPAVPPRAPPAPTARKTPKQLTRTRPAPPSAAMKKVVPKKEVEVITISDSES